VTQAGLTAEPAASNSDAVSRSRFSAAATASDGLTVAGSTLAIVAVTVVAFSVGSATTRSISFVVERRFGVLPCFIVSASTVVSSFV
jgi:hypothetical protein